MLIQNQLRFRLKFSPGLRRPLRQNGELARPTNGGGPAGWCRDGAPERRRGLRYGCRRGCGRCHCRRLGLKFAAGLVVIFITKFCPILNVLL